MRMTTTIIIVMAMMTLITMSVKNNHCDDDELAYNCANRIFVVVVLKVCLVFYLQARDTQV